SPVDLSYEDRIRFVNLGPGLRRALAQVGVVGGTTTLAQTNPQTVMASWYYALTKRSALMGNFGWQNWQQFGEVDVTISSDTMRCVTSDTHLHDTWQERLGSSTVSSGHGYCQPGYRMTALRCLNFIAPRLCRLIARCYGVGLQYEWSRAMTVG